MRSFSAIKSVPQDHQEVILSHSSLRELRNLDDNKSITIDTDALHGIIRPWTGQGALSKNQKRYKIDTNGAP